MDFLKKIGEYFKTKTGIAIIVVILLVGLGYYYKALFVAATVNGSPVSRWSVISEMEKASGKTTLDSLITKKLLEKEVASKNLTASAAEIDAQIAIIEGQVKTQGSTLDAALKSRGMTMADLRDQIAINQKLQKLLVDKVAVTDEEVQKYIKDNGGAPKNAGADFATQIKTQLQGQKFSTEAQKLVDSLKAQANIHYFVNY